MNALAHAIAGFFAGEFTAGLGAFAAAMALIGIATMAIIQAAKDVTPLRRWYQRARLRRWLREGADEARANHGELIPASLSSEPLSVDAAERDILCLAVDNDDQALYDLAIEQMCGQMNTALQMVVDYPARYRRLLLIAGSAAATADLRTLLERERSQFDNTISDITDARITYADARNRVAHQLQRAVDGFQISAAYRWKWAMQVASFLLSALIAMWAVMSTDAPRPIITVIGTGILAGFLAPVARDLAAAIQKLRSA